MKPLESIFQDVSYRASRHAPDADYLTKPHTPRHPERSEGVEFTFQVQHCFQSMPLKA